MTKVAGKPSDMFYAKIMPLLRKHGVNKMEETYPIKKKDLQKIFSIFVSLYFKGWLKFLNSKFIKYVGGGGEYQVVKRGGEYHGCWEENTRNVEKREMGSNIVFPKILRPLGRSSRREA